MRNHESYELDESLLGLMPAALDIIYRISQNFSWVADLFLTTNRALRMNGELGATLEW
jgi:hypothetical protein